MSTLGFAWWCVAVALLVAPFGPLPLLGVICASLIVFHDRHGRR